MLSEINLPRLAQQKVMRALKDSPVILLQGPRQCGKSTLVQMLGKEQGYDYLTFDDSNLLSAAQMDPMGFITDLPPKVILDEIQRIPELFAPIKGLIDRDRKPGRLILTGSANVLLEPKLSDSLAGRMEIIRLHPLSQTEIRQSSAHFITKLFSGNFKLEKGKRLGPDLPDLVAQGGYPPALRRPEPARRKLWYQNYIQTLTQKDIRDMAKISALEIMPKLLSAAANQTAMLMNISDLASPFQVSRPTIREYTTLLERLFLVEFLLPWHSNRLSRLIKTPKLHIGDSGLATALLGADRNRLAKDRTLLGHLLETFVYQELRRMASAFDEVYSFFHFRDKEGDEVDIVMENTNSEVVGVEVKASSTIVGADFKGLRKLKHGSGKKFIIGIVLYDGDLTLRFEQGLYAVPISAMWGEKG